MFGDSKYREEDQKLWSSDVGRKRLHNLRRGGVGPGRRVGNVANQSGTVLVIPRVLGVERDGGLQQEFPTGPVYHSCQHPSPETHGKIKLDMSGTELLL